MARRRTPKSAARTVDTTRKKKKEFDIDTNIKVAYKTGSIIYGKKQVLKALRRNPFKMIIIANNCPAELVNELNYLNSLMDNELFIHKYKGSSWDLGLAMAKPYMISIIGIEDYGDSELKSLMNKRN
ncbi:MAG: 50S ribosomal protein L30e [Candidatus Lokiarchaeota archaeon]|nr:50S ribosomal protein L30e [Candidatus Lokiarchaeota archaeon]MBD3338726.1 50S ribosomal protein L30e [Candidatus Lokiarchaeota archaeon]